MPTQVDRDLERGSQRIFYATSFKFFRNAMIEKNKKFKLLIFLCIEIFLVCKNTRSNDFNS